MRIERFEAGPFAQNSWLVVCEDTRAAVLVDAGAGTSAALDRVEELGLDLKACLLTHAHIDHVDGLPVLAERHPEVPIRLHAADAPLYQAVPRQAEMFGMRIPVLPPVTMDLEDGARIDYGGALRFDVRFAPGHAPGHVILVLTEEGEALVGDVVFAGSIGRTDLPGGDMATLMRSIREQVLTLPDATVLHPGHGPSTTVQRERTSNPFLVGGGTRFA